MNTSFIRLVNNAYAHKFKEFYLYFTRGNGKEYSKFVPQISTTMRLLTSRDGDLSSFFDKINKNDINDTSLRETLIDKLTTQANKGKFSGQLRLDHISVYFRRFERRTEELNFHLAFTTAGLQNIVYTTLPAKIAKVSKVNHPRFLCPF